MESQTSEDKEFMVIAFNGILTSQGWTYLKTLPPDTLQPYQKDILTKLHQHFVAPISDIHNAESRASDPGPIEDHDLDRPERSDRKRKSSDSALTRSDSVDSPKRKRRGRPNKNRPSAPPSPGAGSIKPTSSWGSARLLKPEDLTLHHTLAKLIDSDPEDRVMRFLSNADTPLYPINSEGLRDRTKSEALTEYYFSAKMVRQSSVLGKVNYLFRILLTGDMAHLISGHEAYSKDEFSDTSPYLSQRYNGMSEIEKDSLNLDRLVDREGNVDIPQALLKDLRVVAKRGRRLVGFCERFGTGSLFWLYSLFSNNFIDHRWTLNGPPYQEAMEHFDDLEITEKVATSGANALGDKIRIHLKQVYHIVEPLEGKSQESVTADGASQGSLITGVAGM